jgi:DNA mismatch repair protein MutS
MAGIPHHAAEGYIARLLAAGHKVAIADQMEKPNGRDPSQGSGQVLIDRRVTSVVTPGTVTDPAFVRGSGSTYIVALVSDSGQAGLAYADVTTGELATTRLPVAGAGEATVEAVRRELLRLDPAEIVAREDEPLLECAGDGVTRSTVPPAAWRLDDATENVCQHFGVRSLEPFGCEAEPLAARAAGALLAYLQSTQLNALRQITSLTTYSTAAFMSLDAQTRRNLELVESSSRGGGPTLFDSVDATRTPLGARLLRAWLGQPLLDRAAIERRQDGVEWLLHETLTRARVRELLRGMGDIERVISRVVNQQAGPRELVALGAALRRLPQLRDLLREQAPEIVGQVPTAERAAAEIARALADNPPAQLAAGGAIRPGYSPELDGLRWTLQRDHEYIAGLETTERDRTGIRGLKVGFNKVFGYYIEVSNASREPVPDHYLRKQTLVNAERYITPELKEAEQRVAAAEERITTAERDAWARMTAVVAAEAETIRAAARCVATLDTLAGLAEIAATRGYVRPELTDEDVLRIEAGRHPIVECGMPRGAFVPNDTALSDQDGRIAILTGPNMAGKSTYLRQVALIVLLAQVGSFVPAQRARIGIVDRIFTRIGAQDDLASGQSTFMVEMLETAAILNHATTRSLVVLDEIGRGTSTWDGLAIATAIVEYLHNTPRLGCKTLFATHYHELTALAELLPRVTNYRLDVLEAGDSVTFLHRVVPGGADRSFGVYVAQLAGMPLQVVRRAGEVLRELERDGAAQQRGSRRAAVTHAPAAPMQLTLFGITHPAVERLRVLEVDGLSPLDALTTLYELRKLAEPEIGDHGSGVRRG